MTKKVKKIEVTENYLVDLISDIVEQTISERVQKGELIRVDETKKTKKVTVTESELKALKERGAKIVSVKKKSIIKENDWNYEGSPDAFNTDYQDRWYSDLEGAEYIDKYPQDFIDWLHDEDSEGSSWAETYVLKYKLGRLIDLFSLWVHERY